MKIRTIASKWFALLAAAALVMGVATSCNTTAPPDRVEVSDEIEVIAEVVAIDKAGRIVTLLGPEGNKVDIEAGDEVRNFDQIEVGDKVKVTYYESVAVYLGVPGSQPEAGATEVLARAAKGDKPGGVVTSVIEASASVKAINRSRRTVTLELADGNVITSKVDPSAKAYDTLKVGDTIHVRLTRALAIAVEAP